MTALWNRNLRRQWRLCEARNVTKRGRTLKADCCALFMEMTKFEATLFNYKHAIGLLECFITHKCVITKTKYCKNVCQSDDVLDHVCH